MLASLHSLTKSETIASECQNVWMMDQPVDERGGQAIVAKYLVPLALFGNLLEEYAYPDFGK
jgi:hypothetical protein